MVVTAVISLKFPNVYLMKYHIGERYGNMYQRPGQKSEKYLDLRAQPKVSLTTLEE